jgi:hypothetical protein
MNGRTGCNSVSIGEGIISQHLDLHGFYFTLRGLCFRRTDLVPPCIIFEQLATDQMSSFPVGIEHPILIGARQRLRNKNSI